MMTPRAIHHPRIGANPWLIALASAITLHAGVVLAAVTLFDADPDDPGATAMAVDIDMASMRAEESHLPPGPDSAASAAAEQQEAQQSDNPLSAASVLPQSDDEPIDALNNPEPATNKDAAATETVTASLAALATAPPPAETPASRSVAPTPDGGRSKARAQATWHRSLMAHLNRHKRYPSVTMVKTAEIMIRFTLDVSGRVLSTTIVTGSGDPVFDEAALAMMRRANPVPAPPVDVISDGLTFMLPIHFRIRGG